jgi:imidazolonepropionase-like amidohydrolase
MQKANNLKLAKLANSLLISFLLVATLLGQQTAPAPARTVIRAGRLLDVRTGKTLTNQAIVIENDKIVNVGPDSGAADAGAKVIDLSGKTVLPGLIDAHTHITFDPKFGYDRLAISLPREALIGAKNARITLLAGFTTIRNVGATEFADIALRDAINAGDVPGPRIDASGPALSITGGHCDDNLLPYEWHATEVGVADGVENVQHKVREIIKYGADVSDAHRLGRKVAAHAHGAQGILWATEAGVDSIEHGSYIDDAGIAAMKEHGTYLVPTLYLGDWFLENAPKTGVPPQMLAKAKEVMPAARRNIAHAFASGVKVGFGTDAAVYPHGLNAHEFAVMVKLGLTPLQSIQAATVNDADLLGWSDKIGVIEPNHYADVIAVDGDPLQDVTTLERVKFVMKGGVVYKSE